MPSTQVSRRLARREPKKAAVEHVEPSTGGWFDWAEYPGWALLALLAFFFLSTSWRKWPDALIDFGHDLYIPWRLAQGKLLYRDVNDIYGPLSQYVNAALFRLFGTGMMVLVRANLVVFAGILIATYALFRHAWGKLAAFFAAAIFLSVFAFAQYLATGNYNYAAPYSHEATHGMLVLLLLLLALARWARKPDLQGSFVAGFLLGIELVLKPEFILAGAVITLAAAAAGWRSGQRPAAAAAGAWAAGLLLPTLAFAIWFSLYLPFPEALADASRAWLNATSTSRFTADPVQASFLGLDHTGQNLWQHVAVTLFAAFAIALVCGFAWLAEKRRSFGEQILIGAAAVVALGWLASAVIDWNLAGRCLLGLTLGYAALAGWSLFRRRPAGDTRVAPRFLIALAAAALMARMFLNGRIYHYGFYQAALAGMLIPVAAMLELPVWLGFGKRGKTMALLGGLALFVPGIVALVSESQYMLSLKTLPVGRGDDQFYTFPREVEPTGELLNATTEWLEQFRTPQTLVVLPEGEMINYLARMPNPVAPFVFYTATTAEGRGAQVVADLDRQKPAWVAIISRDLREYGIERYGEAPGKGGEIMQWVNDHYVEAFSVGGDPLDYRQHGVVILRRTDAARNATSGR